MNITVSFIMLPLGRPLNTNIKYNNIILSKIRHKNIIEEYYGINYILLLYYYLLFIGANNKVLHLLRL